MRKPLDAMLAKRGKKPLLSVVAPAQKEGRPGRPPALNEDELRQRRDQLQGIFAAHWPIVGWNLQRARRPLHITDALRPLASLNHPTIELLLLDSFKKPMPDGFLLLRQARKSLYIQLAEAQNGLIKASTKVMEARSAFEQAHNWFAVARDSYTRARKKRKTTGSFRREREKWSRRCESVRAELSRREKNLIEYTEKIRGIEKEIKEVEAHFAQTELLRFVLSERYVFAPLNFANAAAGLPHMGWRRSFLLCSRIECSAETSINYLIFEALNIILEAASPTRAEEAASEIRRQISKRNRFERVREYLGEEWPALERAVLAVWNSSIHAEARPYEIASMFLAALKAPRRVVNPLLDALEKDSLPT
jgi:cellobiose-specific phosphotransferase system component IIA